MAIKKPLIIAGIVCSLSTTQIALSDGVKSSESQETTKSTANREVEPAQPPPLLAPPASAKPIQGKKNGGEIAQPPDPKRSPGKTGEKQSQIQKTAKLSSIGPKLIKSKSPLAFKPRASSSSESAHGNLPAEFVSLLPGKALEGWVVHEGRDDAWSREGDVISCRGAGGGWIRTEKEYSDFHMKFDYRYQPGCNTGVGIRCPSEGNPTFTGIEIQLLDDTAEKYKNLRADQYTGSIYYQVAPSQKPKLKSPREWNQCEVICISDQLTIKINGEIVNEINLAKPANKSKSSTSKHWKLAERPPIGHLALQGHPSQIDFRNLYVKDLAVETASGVRYVDIAEGQGEPVTDATTITIHYVGQLRNGTRFGDTRDFGDPVTVAFDEVIDGWKYGIIGMKVGGRRRLIVPSEMAYGSKGVENLIPPDSTLVFEVELRGFER